MEEVVVGIAFSDSNNVEIIPGNAGCRNLG
jgi:hypothetical protein